MKIKKLIFLVFLILAGILTAINLNSAYELIRPNHSDGQKQSLILSKSGKAQALSAALKEIKLPFYFIPNKGQLDQRVYFYLQGRDKNVYFSPEDVTIVLNNPDRNIGKNLTGGSFVSGSASIYSDSKDNKLDAPGMTWSRWAIRLKLVEANHKVRPAGDKQAEARVSYFKGSRQNWLTDLPTYHSISYPQIWSGIDLNFSGENGHLKFEFKVSPEAEPSCIKLRYEGITGINLKEGGELEVITPVGKFIDEKPVAYQLKNGKKIYIPIAYEILDQAEDDDNMIKATYAFKLGSYDKSQTLYIDPAVLIYSGYLGGSSNDRALAIAIDASGNAYLTGWTASYDFPVAVGPDSTFNGPALGTDAFIAKINPSGNALLYCGYLGGSYDDSGNGIAVDDQGNAYICGFTKSPDFPTVVGPYTSYHGNITQYSDGFIVKINPSGNNLIYSGYLGGTSADVAAALAVDKLGRAYVCGTTESSDFPAKLGPSLRYNGLKDAFVLRVSASGSQLDWSGFIGGTRDDVGTSIAVDANANAYITGYTASTPSNQFPVKNGPKLTQSGGLDAFVAKIDSSGSLINYCGYIGGSSDDYSSGIAVDGSGNAYVTGTTTSASGFPVTAGPDSSYNGGSDAFVAKVNATGSGLVYCGYLGGSADDFGLSIAIDSTGIVYLAGATDSSDFPVTAGPYLTYHGNRDAFFSVLRTDGQGYYYSSFLGGSDLEEANGITADGNGNIYVAGFTRSLDFPVLIGPFTKPGGGVGYLSEDAFISNIYVKLPPLPPQNLRQTSVSETEVNLAWDDKSSNEDGFKIERKDSSGGNWNQIGTVGANITTFKNSGLSEATNYYYRVKAYNDIGDSLYSNELSVLTRPAAPSNLIAKVINERQVDLTWTDNSRGETGYRVERKSGSGNWMSLVTLAANVTSYSDRSVVETTTYSYRVFAFDDSGDSTASNEVSVTTPALTIPLTPSNLQAQAISATGVSLIWTDNSYNEDGFKIERKTGAGGNWIQIGTVSANISNYLDNSVTELTSYYYRVKAYNSAGDSDYSNEAFVTTPENKPKLRVPIASVSFGQVNVCTSATSTTIIYNDGGADLTVSQISRASGSSDFTYGGPAVPFTVPAFSSKIITIKYSPSAIGAASASFNLLSNDPDNSTASFTASGSGFIPVITISLEVERRTEKAWIIRRDYGRITIVVNKAAPYSVAKYRLWRKESSGSYELRHEFSEADFSYDHLVYIDKYLDKGKIYFYRVEALDCYNRVIATSDELGPFSPQAPIKSRPGKIAK